MTFWKKKRGELIILSWYTKGLGVFGFKGKGRMLYQIFLGNAYVMVVGMLSC